MRTTTKESRMMRMLDGSLDEFRDRLSMINYRLTKVEDEIWAKEREFTLPSYVVRRTIPRKAIINQEQRENIFHSKCLIQGQLCVLIIDSRSYANLASTDVVEYLKIPTTNLDKPCTLQWLNDDELRVHEQVLIKFQIGKYQDVVLCDMIPMQASHVLLGIPWQHSHATTYDGRHNTYTVMSMGCKYVLKPMSPSQVIEMYRKMNELRDKMKKQEGHVEAKAQGEREKRKLEGKVKLLLAEHKEIREDVRVESALILSSQKDHELQANPSNSSPPHSISFLLHDPREALSMDTLVGSPDIYKGMPFQGKEDLSCGHQATHPLWCEAFPPKDENLFLEAESTLGEKECDEEEGDVCFSITSCSWCVPIVNVEYVVGRKSAILLNGGALDPVLWAFYHFYPGGYLRAFELVEVSSFGWYSLGVEKNNYCPYSSFVGLIA
ncbi:hypothetical protein KY284_035889 [Solanum tuberosum]|nr:hypothetical protein KY284_035889 [Solanum tuberosum]